MKQPVSPIPITFLITELDDGGAERALVRIVTSLDPQAWCCHVICLGGHGPLVDQLTDADIPVTTLGIGTSSVRTLSQKWSAFRRLVRLLREQRPAVLQTFLFHANLVGRIAARLAGAPVVLSGIRVAERRSKWRLRIDRWTEFLVSKHVCVSEAVAEFSKTQSRLSPARVVAIPNGVDVDRFRDASPVDLASFGISTTAEIVLSVGRLDPQKDPIALLRAFERIADECPRAELMFVGAGPLEDSLRSLAAQTSCARRIHFVGRQQNVAGLMRRATVFALASQWEGMPNVILEAGAAGLPIVSTKTEGVTEIIQHDRTGRLVDRGDIEGLARELKAALDDGDRSRHMASTLQDFIQRDFTWEAVVSRYETLWRSTLEDRR